MSAVVPEESLKKPDNIETQEANNDGGNLKEKTNNTQSVKNEDDFKTPNSEDVDKEKKAKKTKAVKFCG